VAVSETTQEDALRQADALVGEALREVEARCSVLGLYIHDGESSKTSAWNAAVRELRALQDYRTGLLRRRALIREALDCLAGERPAPVPLPPAPNRAAVRTQQQVQIRRRR
jgi:hypothetical protein